MTPRILHEDNHIIAVWKPAGVLSQQDEPGGDSMLERVRGFIKERDRKPGNVYLGLVHRLDRQVSGVFLLAKTSKAASRLSAQIRDRAVDKIYVALVEGSPPHDAGELAHFLSSDVQRGTRVHDTPAPDRKLARLSYRVLRRWPDLAHLEIELDTGRKHQIRAQLAHIGCPILGDGRYGARRPFGDGQLALVAQRLGFAHPTRDERIEIALPPELSPIEAYLPHLPHLPPA